MYYIEFIIREGYHPGYLSIFYNYTEITRHMDKAILFQSKSQAEEVAVCFMDNISVAPKRYNIKELCISL